MASVDSQWYPYDKIYTGFLDLSDTDEIPRKIMDYLLDMPDGTYEPKDDNKRARVRLWKYLYYDGARPIDKPLPTPKQKKQVLFNPDKPNDPENAEKGYRLIPQPFAQGVEQVAQTRIYAYMGRTIASDDLHVQLSAVFDIWVHHTQEANTKLEEAYSRLFAMEQAIIEAFHGINMGGVGTFYFNRQKHPDCGTVLLGDGKSNLGRRVILGLEVGSNTQNEPIPTNGPRLGKGWFG